MNSIEEIMNDIKLKNGEIELGEEDVILVENDDSTIQDIFTKLQTTIGSLFYDEEFGTDLIHFFHENNDPFQMLQMQQVLSQAIKDDDRLDPSTVQVEVTTENNQLHITIYGTSTLTGQQLKNRIRL